MQEWLVVCIYAGVVHAGMARSLVCRSGSYCVHAGVAHIVHVHAHIYSLHAYSVAHAYSCMQEWLSYSACMQKWLSCSGSSLSMYVVLNALEMIVWLVSTCNDLTLFLPELNSYCNLNWRERTWCVSNPFMYFYTLALPQIPAHSLHPLQSL